ncbi:MAG TPA: hypothetical protein VI035_03900 [Solirubrobacterales bacterium]
MKRSVSTLLAIGLVLGFSASAAHATTLGSAVQPPGSAPNACPPNSVIAQSTSDPSTPYSAPGAGTITEWQIDTSLATPGAPVTMVVLKPTGGDFSVVGTDSRTIPAAGSIATFLLSTAINVSGGETLGLYTNGAPVVCYWNGGSTPAGDTLAGLVANSPPASGQTLSRATSDSPSGYTMNLAARFVPAAAPPPQTKKKKCKKKKKRSAQSAKKKCKKKKKG